MKKTITTFGIMIFFGGVFLTICGPNIRQTMRQLKPAQGLVGSDSSLQYEKFKQLALHSLNGNDRALIRLHAEIHDSNKQIRARYFSLLLELRLQNNRLRVRLFEYKECREHNWAAFEYYFNEDMDQLGHTIRDIQLLKEVPI